MQQQHAIWNKEYVAMGKPSPYAGITYNAAGGVDTPTTGPGYSTPDRGTTSTAPVVEPVDIRPKQVIADTPTTPKVNTDPIAKVQPKEPVRPPSMIAPRTVTDKRLTPGDKARGVKPGGARPVGGGRTATPRPPSMIVPRQPRSTTPISKKTYTPTSRTPSTRPVVTTSPRSADRVYTPSHGGTKSVLKKQTHGSVSASLLRPRAALDGARQGRR